MICCSLHFYFFAILLSIRRSGNINKLEKINTAAARFITNNYTQTPGITTQIKQQIHMDLLTLRRQAHRLTIMYKIANNKIDINTHEFLQHSNTHNTRNTHTHKYLTLHSTSELYRHSYFPRTIRDWNSLPQEIIDTNTTETFKKRTLTHLGSRSAT